RGEGNNPATFPFQSHSNQPVYISAENMDWNSEKSEAVFTEKAKLWQEKNVITAGKLIINDKDKTMSGYDKVHTIFYNKHSGAEGPQTAPAAKSAQSQPQKQAKEIHLFADKGGQSGEGPVTVDAAIMNYADIDRIIHFEKDVKVVTTSTSIASERADFYMKPDSSDFDRLYALGK